MRTLLFVPFVLSVASVLSAADPVKQKINLFDVIKSGDVEYHVNPKMELHDDPKDIWKLEGDELHISGRGYGYVATKKDYRDYHLVIEFKWGTKTHGARETKARDNGILLHAYGPHGAYGGTWMASIEAQIIEGGVGDILVLSPKLPDGKELTTSVMSEFSLDRDKEKIWTPGAPKQLVTKGRINWQHRDVDWTDTKGFRGREDKESPPGEWNRLECIADGDHLTYFLNGAKVNEAFECKPSQGRVLLQTEGAEMIVRRYELWPLGQFNEKWNPIQASGGSDVDVREGQTKALSAAESQKLIQLDGPYEAQLVASEPLVLDPVEVTWDAKGRLFVADMLDYPLGPKDPNDPPMSRVLQLIDDDGDGKMDRSVVFAEHMDFVQGLLPYKDGLIATTRSQVLFLKDSDGDGKADVIESLIKGFNPRHAQLQVSAPRWGLDGCVHFNNGLDAKEIYPVANPKDMVEVPRSNFKWDPATGKITPTGGTGQYGGAFDDWGHHFYCSNRNPLMFTVMPYEAMLRNPHAGITQVHEDIAPAGAETRVYPLKITHTTADAHAGTNTAACGLGVYRGDLMPELKNNVFVCDPTGQLVTRYKVEPNGASLKATRVGKNTEFFRSGDEWCRPVNVTTGPDGALYICDMYRHYIDHARFFPEEFVKTHDMREGEKEGRIWRIVPKGTTKLIAKTPGKYHAVPETGWGNEVPAEHAAHATFLKAMKITDAHELASILSANGDDAWMAKMVASSGAKKIGTILNSLDDKFFASFSETKVATIRMMVSAAMADGEPDDVKALLSLLQKEPGKLLWWKPALLQGLGKLPKGHDDAAKEIAALQSGIDAVLADAKSTLDQKLAVLPLLGQRKWDAVAPTVKTLLTTTQPAELTTAALALLRKFSIKQTEPFIYEILPHTSPTLKGQLVTVLAAGSPLELLKRMDRGELPKALIDVEKRWGLQRGKGELAELAKKLFGQPSADRAAVIASYMDCTKKLGDAAKGKAVFQTICVACHKIGDIGQDVGPPLADIKVKPVEGLLSDILDPNRMFEARWCAYEIDTKDGKQLMGLVTGETSEAVTLTMMGGLKEIVQRSNIKEMKSLDRSLMPVGVEAGINKEQMSDLLAFLLGR
ncbi:MAG: DUF1080 domain-containing protein [Verrucomicrobiaceae bacterium]|nr:DUF1080 domain-containing protein [Verrucomicrobiaceae bacterium]